MKLFDYSWEDEQRNYSECMDDKNEEAMDNHIYHELVEIHRWIKKIK